MYERTFARFEILQAVTKKFNMLWNVTLDWCKFIDVSQEPAAYVPWVVSKKNVVGVSLRSSSKKKFGKYVILTGKVIGCEIR